MCSFSFRIDCYDQRPPFLSLMPSRNNIFIKQKRGKTTALMATFKTTSTLTMTSTTSLFASTRFRRSCQSKIEFQSIKPHQWEGNMQQIHQQNTYTRLVSATHKPPSQGQIEFRPNEGDSKHFWTQIYRKIPCQQLHTLNALYLVGRRRWRLISSQAVSCCIYEIPKQLVETVHDEQKTNLFYNRA